MGDKIETDKKGKRKDMTESKRWSIYSRAGKFYNNKNMYVFLPLTLL
jgi:hypothetical protein